MGKDSSPPPAPDYGQAAKDTAAGNLQYARYSTQANRPNEYTPLGSRTWTRGGGQPVFDQAGYDAAMGAYTKALSGGSSSGPGGDPYTPGDVGTWDESGHFFKANQGSNAVAPNRDQFWNSGGNPDSWESQINLTPEGQALFDQNMRISQGLGNLAEGGIGRVQQATSQPFDFSGAGDLQAKAEEAYFSRLNPQLERARAAQEQTLANQGIRLGSEAYGTATGLLGQQENDARKQAILAAYQMTPQMLSQALTIRNQPLNELNALRSGSQVSMPQFQQYGQQGTVAGPNMLNATQAQGQYNQGVYNAGQAQDAQMMQGLFGLAGMAGQSFMPGLMGLGMGGGG